MLRLLGQVQTEAPDYLPPQAMTPEEMTTAHWVMIAVFLLGVPLLVRELVAIYRRRGLGLPVDRAWPPVFWARGTEDTLFIALFSLILHAVVSIIVMLILQSTVLRLVNLESLSPPQQMLATMLMVSLAWIVFLAIIILWTHKMHRAPLAALGFSLPDAAAGVGVAARVLLASMPLILALSLFSQYIHYLVRGRVSAAHSILQTIAPQDQDRPELLYLAIIFFMTTAVIPFFEELFYRGFLQNTLLRLGRPWLAIVLSSAIFAAMHLGNIDGAVSFLPLMALSVALGYAFYRTRSLLTCWLMHMAFNAYNLTLAMMAH